MIGPSAKILLKDLSLSKEYIDETNQGFDSTEAKTKGTNQTFF